MPLTTCCNYWSALNWSDSWICLIIIRPFQLELFCSVLFYSVLIRFLRLQRKFGGQRHFPQYRRIKLGNTYVSCTYTNPWSLAAMEQAETSSTSTVKSSTQGRKPPYIGTSWSLTRESPALQKRTGSVGRQQVELALAV